MKLHHNNQDGLNIIKAYTENSVSINEEIYARSVIVQAHYLESAWAPQSIDELDGAAIRELAKLDTEIILLGTGQKQRFPDRRLFVPLYDRNIGIEVMNTPAACRTYNILLEEGRAVTAALLID
ncbi:MAG: Mth938-like domain-containing protein [Sulfuriflexus sp.]|nr:Mth938-like domain-containing protein [Sulfuriflexus sp.]